MLERDLPQFGTRIRAETSRRFRTIVVRCHGQACRGAEQARTFAITESTVRRSLDLLVAALVVRGQRHRGLELKDSVVHAGSEVVPLAVRIRALPLARFSAEIEPRAPSFRSGPQKTTSGDAPPA